MSERKKILFAAYSLDIGGSQIDERINVIEYSPSYFKFKPMAKQLIYVKDYNLKINIKINLILHVVMQHIVRWHHLLQELHQKTLLCGCTIIITIFLTEMITNIKNFLIQFIHIYLKIYCLCLMKLKNNILKNMG